MRSRQSWGHTGLVLATFQALAVLLTSVLPGALFVFEYEREYARMAISDFNERLIVFLGMSSVFGVLSLPLLYQGYRKLVVTESLQRGDPLPWWIWLVVASYVVVPLVLGALIGRAASEQKRFARPFTGPRPHPRAWDALFKTPGLGGYLKLRLKDVSLDNQWVMGAWATKDTVSDGATRPGSYAAAYPHDQDLYLVETYMIDNDGIHFEDPAQPGRPIARGQAILVRWDEVAYAEFVEG